MNDDERPNRGITNELAIEIARNAAEKSGFPFVGELVVWESCDYQFHVMSNAECRGLNCNVWIDRETGAVMDIRLSVR